MELMEAVWTPAVARVHEEVADMQQIADAEKAGIKIEPWDYRYYAEKVRKAKYDLDETQITPYMQLENLREGMFHMAKELFGFSFKPVDAEQGAGVPPRRARLGSHEPEGRTDRPLVLRPVRAQGQALGRVDERLPHAGKVRRRHQDDRLEQLELREGQARRAGAGQLGGRTHAVPRIRPRAARPEFERELPVRGGHRGARATTSSSRRSCSSTGCRRRRSSTSTRCTTRPASRSRPNWWPRSMRPRSSTKASRRSSTCRARSST